MAKGREKLTLIRLCLILGFLVWLPTISRMLVGIDEPKSPEPPPPAKTAPPLDVRPVSHRSDVDPIRFTTAPVELRLSATHLSVDRRSAVINGKLLHEGDTIHTDAALFEIQNIESGRVELISGSRHYELTLEDDEWGRWVPFTTDQAQ